MDYVIEIVCRVHARRGEVAGVEIDSAPPVLRHFGARFRRAAPPSPDPSGPRSRAGIGAGAGR